MRKSATRSARRAISPTPSPPIAMPAAIRERLSGRGPGNIGWQQALAVAYGRVGDVLIRQGKLPEALVAHSANFAIRERLAQNDPSNAGWQRDLSYAHDRVGDVLWRQGAREESLKNYRASFADPGTCACRRSRQCPQTDRPGAGALEPCRSRRRTRPPMDIHRDDSAKPDNEKKLTARPARWLSTAEVRLARLK